VKSFLISGAALLSVELDPRARCFVLQEAVAHTLLHGMTKCTTTVAFFEDFEDSG